MIIITISNLMTGQNQKKLLDLLLEKGLITNQDLPKIEPVMKKSNKPLETILTELEIVKDEQMGKLIAEENGWKYINLKKEQIDEKVLRMIPQSVAEKNKIIAFAQIKSGIKVAMSNPADTGIIHLIQKRTGSTIIPFYTTPKDIEISLSHYKEEIGSEFDELIEAHAKEAIGGEAKDSAVVQIVDLILYHGYESAASDIHVDPQEGDTVIRFRIDGILHDILTIPKNIHDLILTRIKIMAKLRTDEHQSPQDGKLKYSFEGEPVDIRVSIVPTTKGENAVMRLLSEKSRQFTMEELGLAEVDYKKLTDNVKKPWGMILATGPTGSGKTTSLYSILKILNRRDVNIATIEDPVEYNIDGITQIHVNRKAELTFATGLRSIVRQDPDIIMVGEIRDTETANIAVSAAMTGHLVLSTLHTNDAPTTLPRLLDMGVEPFLVASTVNIAIGQRLVRKTCTKCVEEYEVSVEELKDKVPEEVLEKLKNGSDKIILHRGKGCDVCQHTGYKGRMGVFEVMEMDDDLRVLINKNANADAIREQAVKNGMTTMLDDAIGKVKKGSTTLEELLRVIKD